MTRWVSLAADDPLAGYANADNVETLGKDELGEYLGVLAPTTMTRVNEALAVGVGIHR